jgi:hydrogenase expression/formation protein HypC
MCIAIPTKLIKLDGTSGWVNIGGCELKVRLDLIDAPRVGDYVIVHAGFAIHKIDEVQAKEALSLVRDDY